MTRKASTTRKQSEFSSKQYREYKSPDICAVCHAPAETREVVEETHARMRYTGRKAKTHIKVAFFHVGVTKNLHGKQRPVLVKLCEKHAKENAEGTESHEATYLDPRTAAGYRWWFAHGQLPLWGKAQHEIDAEREAEEARARQARIDALINGVLPLALPAHTDGEFIATCGRCGAACNCDPRQPCGTIRCEDCKRHITKRYDKMREPRFARNGFQGGMWYAQVVIKSGPAIELPASTPEPEPPTPEPTDTRALPTSTVKLNKSNVWVFFDNAPDPITRAALKAAGLRYSHNKRGWWIPVGQFNTERMIAA